MFWRLVMNSSELSTEPMCRFNEGYSSGVAKCHLLSLPVEGSKMCAPSRIFAMQFDGRSTPNELACVTNIYASSCMFHKMCSFRSGATITKSFAKDFEDGCS